MSVWLAIPSARPPEQVEPVLREWRERGYEFAVWRDPGSGPLFGVAFTHTAPYPGYARAVNYLVAGILAEDPACDWIVTGGDDVLPDPNHSAEQIARECSEHFVNWLPDLNTMSPGGYIHDTFGAGATFGIMQPTGDREFGDAQGPYIDRVAGSPWMGREWCLRANQGKGPLYPGFTHMFVDECLQAVSQRLGVFWQRPDLIHKHMHWGRRPDAHVDHMPKHLKKWNTPEHWRDSKALFDKLKADGFKECMPL